MAARPGISICPPTVKQRSHEHGDMLSRRATALRVEVLTPEIYARGCNKHWTSYSYASMFHGQKLPWLS